TKVNATNTNVIVSRTGVSPTDTITLSGTEIVGDLTVTAGASEIVNVNGAQNLNSNVLKSLTISGPSGGPANEIDLSGATVNTTGGQTYTGPITLKANAS